MCVGQAAEAEDARRQMVAHAREVERQAAAMAEQQAAAVEAQRAEEVAALRKEMQRLQRQVAAQQEQQQEQQQRAAATAVVPATVLVAEGDGLMACPPSAGWQEGLSSAVRQVRYE